MAREWLRASAPGKLFLLGEHAVLRGRHALVAAVNQRIYVTLVPREDDMLCIHSGLGEHATRVSELTEAPWCRFAIAALRRAGGVWRDNQGLDMWIESDFSERLGLGSSAAVTAAVLAAIFAWFDHPLEPMPLFREGLRVIQGVQGRGSGADLAASIYGGVVLFRSDPLTVEPMAPTMPLTVLYSGVKVSTVEVVAHVDGRVQRMPGVADTIFDAMDVSAMIAARALQRQDWPEIGELLNVNQGLMEALGVSTSNLLVQLEAMRADPGIFGAKLSGAGMGDCLVGVGKLEHPERFDDQLLTLEVSHQGVVVEV